MVRRLASVLLQLLHFGFDGVELIVGLFLTILLRLSGQGLALRDGYFVVAFGLCYDGIAGRIGCLLVGFRLRVGNILVGRRIGLGQSVSGLRILFGSGGGGLGHGLPHFQRR